MNLDKSKLSNHLEICIALAQDKEEGKIAEVLRNLRQEILDGEFDSDEDKMEGAMSDGGYD